MAMVPYKLNEDKVTKLQLNALEKVLDKVFARIGMDVEFTKHFLDRVNDIRNKKQITVKELAVLFKKEYVKWGKPIARMGDDAEGVMSDLASDVNIPFVLNWNPKKKELEMYAKTIMRKKNFSTPDKKFKVEEVPGTSTTSVAGAGSNPQGIVIVDRRRGLHRQPRLLKRFRKYMDD